MCLESILEAVGCTERAITLVDWRSEAPGSWGVRLPCGFLCSLCSVSSAVRDRGQGTAETPEDPKLTPVGEKSPAGEGVVQMLTSQPWVSRRGHRVQA